MTVKKPNTDRRFLSADAVFLLPSFLVYFNNSIPLDPTNSSTPRRPYKLKFKSDCILQTIASTNHNTGFIGRRKYFQFSLKTFCRPRKIAREKIGRLLNTESVGRQNRLSVFGFIYAVS